MGRDGRPGSREGFVWAAEGLSGVSDEALLCFLGGILRYSWDAGIGFLAMQAGPWDSFA